MSESATCEAPYCRRRVATTYDFYPFCFDHKDISKVAKPASGSREVEQIAGLQIERPIPAGGSGTVSHTSSIISKACGISQEDSYAIVLSNHQFTKNHGDLSVPENADKVQITKFLEQMVDNGIHPDRVRIVEYRGYNAYNESAEDFREKIARAPQASKKVIALDAGTEDEVIVDPSIASLAIARDRSIPIEADQELFPSGRTPFGDSPWVGSDQEYRDGSLLFWDSRSDDKTTDSD